jgi:predicted GH43/DUF377 family glycosyl hydrolase
MYTFERYSHNPILSPIGDSWESKDVFNPTAIVRDDKVYMLYRAEDNTGIGQWNGTSRIGLAVSEDGIHFTRYPEPVLVPTEPYELPGGCEDPRVTQIGNTYYLTYTAFNGHSAHLCLATSQDLVHWTKHGILYPDFAWSKSGAILPQPINGRYIMYFGDTAIWMAYSYDLIHWTPIYDPVMHPSTDPAAFDSVLVEPGPQPILTDDGIVLIYNGARQQSDGKLVYSAGYVVLDKDNPRKVLYRSREPFFAPITQDELVGQVDNVVFVEGLVEFRGALYMYYGMADSRIGVAMGKVV